MKAEQKPRHGAHRLVWRFVSGAHMDGIRRSNATWNRPGTMPRDASSWAKRRRRHRAQIRWGILAFAALQVTGLIKWRLALSYVDVAIGARLLEFGAILLWRYTGSITIRRGSWRTVKGFTDIELNPDQEREAIDNIVIPDNVVDDLPSVVAEGLKRGAKK